MLRDAIDFNGILYITKGCYGMLRNAKGSKGCYGMLKDATGLFEMLRDAMKCWDAMGS